MVCRYPQFFGLPLSFYSPFEAVANFGLLDLVQYWNQWEDCNANADRTLKSEVLGPRRMGSSLAHGEGSVGRA